jgi:serine/threonine-protein kinase HipA
MAKPTLHVFLHRTRIGSLTRATANSVEFRFSQDAPLDLSLSLSMPTLPGQRVSADKCSPFFNGLLPDGPDARLSMARSFDSMDTSTFNLLARGGLDCAGAVQVWHEEQLPERKGRLEALTDDEIGQRLLASMTVGGSERDDDEHWSVSGAQGKVALRREGGSWSLPWGTEPSSHIVKPGTDKIDEVSPGDQALLEHVTMDAARRLGIDAAATEFREFAGVPAIVVERFDRRRDGDTGVLARVHQEDLCQALGVDSAHKYEEDGGPGVSRAARLLRDAIASPEDARSDIRRLATMVAFNYIVGAPDAHAKNYAVLHAPEGEVVLAPMYDSATGAFARKGEPHRRRFPKAAMYVGATRIFDAATASDWESFFLALDLDAEDSVRAAVAQIAADAADALSGALGQSGAGSAAIKRIASLGVVDHVALGATAARSALAHGGPRSTASAGSRPWDRCGAWMPAEMRRCALPSHHLGEAHG